MPFVSHHTRRWLTASAFACLLAAVAFTTVHLVFERAPRINVRWAASIDAPTRAMWEPRQDVARAIGDLDYLEAYPIASVLAALPLVPLIASRRRRPSPAFWCGLVAALAFTVPMFGIMLDWGRLLNIHVMATAIVILAFVLEDRATERSVSGVRIWWLSAAIVVGLSLYLTTWSIRHCCADPLRTGVFRSV